MSFIFNSDTNRIAIYESVYEVEAQVKAITGADTCIIIKEDFPVYGKMSLRHHHQEQDLQDYNILYLKEKFSDRFPHLMLHELYHIVRYDSKTTETLRRFGTPEDAWNNFLVKHNAIPKTEVERRMVIFFMQNWGSGFISVCPDIWIETEIHSKHPDIRPMQLKSLDLQAQELVLSLKMNMPGIVDVWLDSHFAAQYIFLRKMGELVGKNYVKPYSSHRRLLDKSKTCYQIYSTCPRETHDDDIETTLKIATYLGVAELLEISEQQL